MGPSPKSVAHPPILAKSGRASEQDPQAYLATWRTFHWAIASVDRAKPDGAVCVLTNEADGGILR